MDVDKKSSKLLLLLVFINLAAVTISFATIIFVGVLTGLAVFTVLIILLPLLVQYIYLDRNQ